MADKVSKNIEGDIPYPTRFEEIGKIPDQLLKILNNVLASNQMPNKKGMGYKLHNLIAEMLLAYEVEDPDDVIKKIAESKSLLSQEQLDRILKKPTEVHLTEIRKVEVLIAVGHFESNQDELDLYYDDNYGKIDDAEGSEMLSFDIEQEFRDSYAKESTMKNIQELIEGQLLQHNIFLVYPDFEKTPTEKGIKSANPITPKWKTDIYNTCQSLVEAGILEKVKRDDAEDLYIIRDTSKYNHMIFNEMDRMLVQGLSYFPSTYQGLMNANKMFHQNEIQVSDFYNSQVRSAPLRNIFDFPKFIAWQDPKKSKRTDADDRIIKLKFDLGRKRYKNKTGFYPPVVSSKAIIDSVKDDDPELLLLQ